MKKDGSAVQKEIGADYGGGLIQVPLATEPDPRKELHVQPDAA